MILFLIGLISGVISGMGIGGGTILIPALVFIVGTNQHVAQSINLASFLPTAAVAIYIHARNKNIKFKIALSIVVFGIVGAFIGSKMAVSLSSDTLKKFFGIFLLFMGFYEFLRKGKK